MADTRILEIVLKATDSTAKGLDSATGRFGGLGKSLLGLASAATGMMIMDRVSDFMWEASEAAMADEQSAATLANTLKNVTGATDAQIAAAEDYILKTELAAGVADDKLRPAYSALVVASKDAAEAQDLMSIAMDTAQGRELDLETVAKALAKARNGNTAALGKLGIATKDASGKTLSYDQILRNLADTYGGAVAANAETAAGKQAKLSVAMGEFKEMAGSALLPVIQKLMDWGTKLLGWFSNLPGPMQKAIVIGGLAITMLAGLALVIGPLIPLMGALLGPIGLVIAGIAAVVAIVILCIKYHEQIGAAFAAAWDAVKAAFEAVWNALKAAWDAVVGFFEKIGETLARVFRAAWEKVSGALGWLWENVLSWVFAWPLKLYQTVRGPMGEKIAGVFRDAWSWTLGAVEWLGGKIGEWFRGLPGKIVATLGYLGSLLYSAGKDILQGLWNGLKDIWAKITSWISEKLNWIKDKFKGFFGLFSPSRLMFDMGQNIMEGLRLGMQEGGAAALRTTDRMVEGLAASLTGLSASGSFALAGAGGGATINIGSITLDGSKMSSADFGGLIASIQDAVRMGG